MPSEKGRGGCTSPFEAGPGEKAVLLSMGGDSRQARGGGETLVLELRGPWECVWFKPLA